tara:strand:- start:1849 stop:2607 length:759 start_codon:yes stop_codon:yes gene_type:complete
MYTLDNIHTSPSYEALKRNGFNDIDVVAYYGIPKGDTRRGTMFAQIKADGKAKEIKFSYIDKVHTMGIEEKVGTQKCTSNVDIDSVRDMALDYMSRDWEYRGRTFNMNEMGWSFAFNDRKRALGLCSYYPRKIYLSQWFIEHNTREMKMWVNTMVHEISHAINHKLGGRGHDWQWKQIFMSFGGDGNRCSDDAEFTNLLDNPISKYTMLCPNGHTKPSYKIKRRNSSCGVCNKEHGLTRYQEQFKMKQIQNY